MIKELIDSKQLIFKYRKYPELSLNYKDILEVNDRYIKFVKAIIDEIFTLDYPNEELKIIINYLKSDTVIDRLHGLQRCNKIIKLRG